VIIPHIDGITEWHIPTPIPHDQELVQLLGIPLKEYRLISVNKKDLRPYDAEFVANPKGFLSGHVDGGIAVSAPAWSASYLANLKKVLHAGKKYKAAEANLIYEHMEGIAETYLQ
jgi:hypothetical protein